MMSKNVFLHCLAALLFAPHFGCAQSHVPFANDGEEDADDANEECERLCETRAPLEANDGWCPVDGWSTEARPCAQACEAWNRSETRELVRECIEESPLCFETMDQCLEARQRQRSCIQWCGDRLDRHEDDGFCTPTLEGVPDRDCESVCTRALLEEFPNVEDCIRDNPLCFIGLADCAEA